MSPTQVQHAYEAPQQTYVARENDSKTLVDFRIRPCLVGLAAHFRVFEGTLDYCAEDAGAHSARDCAQLDATRPRNSCHHELIPFKLGIEQLSNGELTGSIDDASKKGWKGPPVEPSDSM